MVGACVLNISINFFFSRITMINYQVTLLLDRFFSNGLEIISANYFCIHTVFTKLYKINSLLYVGLVVYFGLNLGPPGVFGNLGRVAIYFQGSREHWLLF